MMVRNTSTVPPGVALICAYRWPNSMMPSPIAPSAPCERVAAGPTRSMSRSKPSLTVSEPTILPIAVGVQALPSISTSRRPIPARNVLSPASGPSPAGASWAQRTAASTDCASGRTSPAPGPTSSSLLSCSPRWCSASKGPCSTDQPLLTSPIRYRSGSRMSL